MSVIIPALNAADTLPFQLEALAGQTYRGAWEVILADNGSTDRTRQIALRWADRLPSLRVIDALGRHSASYTRNVAAAAAEGDLIVSCDADDVATSSWLEAIVRAASHADIVRGALDRTTLKTNGSESHEASQPEDLAQLSSDGFLPFASTANCAVWSAVLQNLGGWNPDYLVGEDKEFSWRAQLAGYTFGLAPDAVMLKRERLTARATGRQWFAYGWWGTKLYRRFRGHGMPRSSVWKAMTAWLKVLIGVPYAVRSRDVRVAWLRTASLRLGRIVGSVRNGVLYL